MAASGIVRLLGVFETISSEKVVRGAGMLRVEGGCGFEFFDEGMAHVEGFEDFGVGAQGEEPAENVGSAGSGHGERVQKSREILMKKLEMDRKKWSS